MIRRKVTVKHLSTVKKIIKTFTSLVLLATFALPQSTLTTQAAESVAEYNSNIHFVPFRDEIPYYLSVNSSIKSPVVKQLWAKVFYEESNWNNNHNFYDSNYTDWYKKYNKTPYIGLGGGTKILDKKITLSTGDFEAFFGNTLEANPEFLGELLSLKGSAQLGATNENGELLQSDATSTLRNVVGNYLLTDSYPSKYDTYLVDSIVNLTKAGKYLDGSLKEVSCNNIRADYCMLSTLAGRYKKLNPLGESYLSETQNKWIESYILELYDAYTLNNNPTLKNIVTKCPALYDLIARSSYAANNRNGYGNKFFDYVVKSNKGGGAWLNLNNSINLPSIVGVDDLTIIFNLSNGWCGGNHHTNKCDCSNHGACVNNASAYDKMAMSIFNNTTAFNYIQSCDITKNAFGRNATDQNGWWFRYSVKHMDLSSSNGSLRLKVDAAYTKSTTGRSHCHSECDEYGNGSGADSTASYTTISVDMKKVAEISTVPSKVIVGAWYEGQPELADGGAVREPGYERANQTNSSEYLFFKTKPLIYFTKRVEVPEDNTVLSNLWHSCVRPSHSACRNIDIAKQTARTKKIFYEFDTHACPDIANSTIEISTAAFASCYATGKRTSFTNHADCGALPTVYVEVPISNCDMTGHKFNNGTIKWNMGSDGMYSSADITYKCNSCGKLHTEHCTNISTKFSGNSITYIAKTSGNSFTKVVNINDSSKGITTEVLLNSSIANGYSATSTSGSVYMPGGTSGLVKMTSTHARLNNGSIYKGVLQPGVKQIALYYDVSNSLTGMKINVHSANGKIIGMGGTNISDSVNNGVATVEIYSASDLDLLNSYVTFTAEAYTEHKTHVTHSNPPESTATITFTKLKLYY